PAATPAVAYYPPSAESQTEYQAGMPPGTRGGLSFVHTFPADGEYRFNLNGLARLNSSALESEHSVVLLLDGAEVFRATLGGAADFDLTERRGPAGSAEIAARFSDIPVRVTAGPHRVTATFVERSRAQSLFWAGSADHGRMPRMLSGVEVLGPYQVTGVAMTESRSKIFICYPETAGEQAACARRITDNLARRAFGRQSTDEDLATLLPFYEAGLEA